MKNCIKCGNIFLPYYPSVRYCNECRNSKCPECGDRKNHYNKYCSKKCANKNNYINTKFKTNWVGIKLCQNCNISFLSTTGNRKYCDDCIKQFKVCPECKKEKSIHDQFCSNSCAGKWKYRNSEKVRSAIREGKTIQILTAKGKPSPLRGKPRPYLRGINNPNWNGGTYSTERAIDMGRLEYKNWRLSVFKRDNYTCQKCHQKGKKLNADHVLPYKLFPELRYSITNGRTLCESCHRKTPMYGEAVKKVSRAEFLIF